MSQSIYFRPINSIMNSIPGFKLKEILTKRFGEQIMSYMVEDIDKLLSTVPKLMVDYFRNEDGSLRLHDFLTWYYSAQMDTRKLLGNFI